MPNTHSVIHLCVYILFTRILGGTRNDWPPGEKQAETDRAGQDFPKAQCTGCMVMAGDGALGGLAL